MKRVIWLLKHTEFLIKIKNTYSYRTNSFFYLIAINRYFFRVVFQLKQFVRHPVTIVITTPNKGISLLIKQKTDET